MMDKSQTLTQYVEMRAIYFSKMKRLKKRKKCFSIAQKVESNNYAAKRLQIWSLHPEPSRVIWAMYDSKQCLFEARALFYMWPWENLFWSVRVHLSGQQHLNPVQMIGNKGKFIIISVEKRSISVAFQLGGKMSGKIVEWKQRHLAGAVFLFALLYLHEEAANVCHKRHRFYNLFFRGRTVHTQNFDNDFYRQTHSA